MEDIEKIQYYFSFIEDVNINKITDYIYKLSNNNINIELSWGRFYEDFQITFTKINSKKEYTIGEILRAKDLLGKKILTPEEIEVKKSLSSSFESNLYNFSLITRKYLPEILKGDFSILEPK